MAINKVSNFSDLIHRVTASCFLHPVAAGRHVSNEISASDDSDCDDVQKTQSEGEEEEEEKERWFRIWEEPEAQIEDQKGVMEMEMLIGEVFEGVSAMKRAYVSLQEAHCPWDPDKMRICDVAVVAELRRLGVLRERFQLKREVKVKEVEVENLREKLRTAATLSSGGNGGGKKGKSHHQSKRRVSCSSRAPPVALSPAPEIFEATMSMVREASKSFTALLLSLMKSAHWDIAAAVRSIKAAAGTTTATAMDSIVGPNHAKYAMESYVNRKVFQGFDHETFYMDGSLSSLLHPDQFRRDCFTQYRDMKAMDPIELLGILPTCDFGKFCSKKYLSIIHPKMEESLFGDLEQRCQVLAGNHPRSRFYGEFLGLAKAIWLLHLLAFSLEPPPSYFEGSSGAEFHSQYMESVARFPGGRVVVGQVVGFPVSPGFKLANGSVIKARVYLVPKNGL